MAQSSDRLTPFEAEVAGRFGILPNFFRSANAAPELIQNLWSFAKAGYLDNPIPAVFKERLFVALSRFCPARYCIVRHVGFLLGHGRPAGDETTFAHSIDEVVQLLKRPTPWNRDMPPVYVRLEGLKQPLVNWPEPQTELEDLIFACAAVVFAEPARGESARLALVHVLGPRHFEYLIGFLAFIRTAHYWTILHPEIETEEDMRTLMRDHEELSALLLEDPQSDRCEMGERLFDELKALRDLNEREELQKAKNELEEKDRHKDKFIAMLAHELRNPLAAIRAAADAMGRMKLTDHRVELLRQRLDRQSTIMTRMLDDLLDAARIATGKISIQLENIDLRDILRDVIGENGEHAKTAGIRFEFAISEIPCPVRADCVRLSQIIDNVLANAFKFTPDGGRVMVRLFAEGGSALLRIEDSGVGFDRKLAERLFEPFVQEEQQMARINGGLGLGLAISKSLVELHRGSISRGGCRPESGSIFIVELPGLDRKPSVPHRR